jgi:inward rectifier potassium channel
MFSNLAVIGPYHETTSFSFRIANGSPNELIEVEVRILLCMTQSTHGVRTRYFHELGLERQKISFFPMDWTVAHPITEDSPLYQVTSDELEKRDAEFLVLINAVDDNSCQVVHARASYKWNEVVWGARFKDMYRHTRKGRIRLDLKRIHDIQEIDSPDVPSQTVWDI